MGGGGGLTANEVTQQINDEVRPFARVNSNELVQQNDIFNFSETLATKQDVINQAGGASPVEGQVPVADALGKFIAGAAPRGLTPTEEDRCSQDTCN